MSLIKQTPSRDVPRLYDDWDLFDRFFGGRPMGLWPRTTAEAPAAQRGAFWPPVDITQDENEIVLRAEVPGVSKDDVELTVHEDSLTIKGTKRAESEKKEGSYRHTERTYGEFIRTFQLPANVDSEKVAARFKDGVLEVRLPVAESAKPHRIEIGH